MNRIYFSRLLSITLLLMLIACQSKAQSAPISTLKPGDRIDGMMLTTGAVEALPIWAFCSPQNDNYEITSDCDIPVSLSKVAIGHVFNMADEIPANLDWAEGTWNLSIDEQPIDLDLFGTYDFVLPSMVSNPGPVREVFRKFTAWDVVLTDLKPGRHTLRGTVQFEFDTYSWVAGLVIEEQ